MGTLLCRFPLSAPVPCAGYGGKTRNSQAARKTRVCPEFPGPHPFLAPMAARVVKFAWGDALHRVRLSDATVSALAAAVGAVAGPCAPGPSPFTFTYTDDEGDRVTIGTDADLVDAFDVSASTGHKTLRVDVGSVGTVAGAARTRSDAAEDTGPALPPPSPPAASNGSTVGLPSVVAAAEAIAPPADAIGESVPAPFTPADEVSACCLCGSVWVPSVHVCVWCRRLRRSQSCTPWTRERHCILFPPHALIPPARAPLPPAAPLSCGAISQWYPAPAAATPLCWRSPLNKSCSSFRSARACV